MPLVEELLFKKSLAEDFFSCTISVASSTWLVGDLFACSTAESGRFRSVSLSSSDSIDGGLSESSGCKMKGTLGRIESGYRGVYHLRMASWVSFDLGVIPTSADTFR